MLSNLAGKTRPPAWNKGLRATRDCARPGCTQQVFKSGDRAFCSSECRKLSGAQKTGARYTCLVCGHQEYGKRGQKYCSDECSPNVYKCFNPECIVLIRSRCHSPTKQKKFCSPPCREVAGARCACPSAEELSLAPTLAKLGYVHTGDSKFYRRWPDGSIKNPDYVNFKEKKILEYFGTYWHQKDVGRESYIKDQWAQLGWDCTIVWDYEREQFLSGFPSAL